MVPKVFELLKFDCIPVEALHSSAANFLLPVGYVIFDVSFVIKMMGCMLEHEKEKTKHKFPFSFHLPVSQK